MSVDIEPLELSFRRPFTYEVSQTLTIKNPNKTPVAFKAMKQEPPPDAKCRDKFLVQSAPITGDKEFSSIPSVFDSTEKSAISERKIRVNWLAASADEAAPTSPAIAATPSKQTAVNGGSTDTPEAPRTFASPSAGAESPPPYSDEAKSEPEDVKSESPKSAVTAAAATISTAAKEATTTDATIRQRVKTSATGVKEASGQLAQAVPQNVQGVPVKITALLCFLAFLVGYFFF
ncbi:phosphatidylinositol-binding protein scs2 [Amphichorda felina]